MNRSVVDAVCGAPDRSDRTTFEPLTPPANVCDVEPRAVAVKAVISHAAIAVVVAKGHPAATNAAAIVAAVGAATALAL